MSQTDNNSHDTVPPSMDPATGTEVEPPKDFLGILKRLGPGLIIAGSIVGSGELIATTKTGAQAGITLLWLIIIGCVIKVFVQIELGRYTIGHGETTLNALDRVPGPRLIVSWVVWFWVIMIVIGLAQVGGIVGGVGQSLALAFPMKGDYAEAIKVPSAKEMKHYVGWQEDMAREDSAFSKLNSEAQQRIETGQKLLAAKLAELNAATPQSGDNLVTATRDLIDAERKQHDAEKAKASAEILKPLNDAVAKTDSAVKGITKRNTVDDKYWASIVALFTIALLYRGRYNFIQNFSTVLVVTFTFITIGNVISLQMQPEFHLTSSEILGGLWFGLPELTPPPPGVYGIDPPNALGTALATFGIIGVGASELVMYPYWCIEKGYAKFTGPRSDEQSWSDRARGWIMVMHYDAFASMVVYTIATIAFFLMGVAVMYRQGLDPEGMRMTSTLLEQYVPVFGEYARWLFLAGAIAVLYSTFLVANASFGRIYTDALKVYGIIDRNDQKVHDRWVGIFCTILPLIQLGIFWTGFDPAKLVLLGGTLQALMLPLLGIAALYLRFRWTDVRLKPGKLWDGLLIVSCIGLGISGGWKVYSIFF